MDFREEKGGPAMGAYSHNRFGICTLLLLLIVSSSVKPWWALWEIFLTIVRRIEGRAISLFSSCLTHRGIYWSLRIASHQILSVKHLIHRIHMWGGGPIRVLLHEGIVKLQISSFPQLNWKRKNWGDRFWDGLLIFHQLQLPIRLYSVAVRLHRTLGRWIR